ncbi:hypothetical protein [Rickettsia endosymbiont of Urophora cardui]|uniref:hypothetical protein n=1 Tax=Rickettsia endosymbiont of Urophora cardui TaxID=3066265 RepID=UPI00313D9B68
MPKFFLICGRNISVLAIEKINSMVHRVYSKSLDIKKLTIKQLQEIEDFLNNLPRKVLGYKTPNEVWEENINLA